MPAHLDVAKWSKATACKAEGASPRPFESDRRVQASLAQWTRAAGFYPAGRPFESVTRHQFNSPVAQLAARLAVNQEVRGSRPRRGASSDSSRCGADGSARDLGSRGRSFETCHRDQITGALGCGRSSMAELRNVNPPVPVRLRPVTPKRMCNPGVANSSGRVPGSYPGQVRVRAPGDAPHNNPLVAE